MSFRKSTGWLLCLALSAPPSSALPGYIDATSFDRLTPRQANVRSPVPVPTTGDHAFIPPGPGDTRGPCPALNAMANHGYIARNGYTNIAESSKACQDVFGLSPDFATFLGVLAAVQAGDGNWFSIGATAPKALVDSKNPLNPLLGSLRGTPLGLNLSHNRFEADSSVTRRDAYEPNGDPIRLHLPFMQNLLAQNKTGYYELEDFGRHVSYRFQYCISTNPYCNKISPVGLVLPQGTSSFNVRMFANYGPSSPRPGALRREDILSFHAVTEASDGTLTYTEGNERVPSDFYHSSIPYTFATLGVDVASLFAMYPDQIAVGANTGTVNTFTPVNFTDIPGGVMNGRFLAQGNNAVCFFLESIGFFLPDLVRNGGVFGNIGAAVDLLVGKIAQMASTMGCPSQGLVALREDMSAGFPQWTMSL